MKTLFYTKYIDDKMFLVRCLVRYLVRCFKLNTIIHLFSTKTLFFVFGEMFGAYTTNDKILEQLMLAAQVRLPAGTDEWAMQVESPDLSARNSKSCVLGSVDPTSSCMLGSVDPTSSCMFGFVDPKSCILNPASCMLGSVDKAEICKSC